MISFSPSDLTTRCDWTCCASFWGLKEKSRVHAHTGGASYWESDKDSECTHRLGGASLWESDEDSECTHKRVVPPFGSQKRFRVHTQKTKRCLFLGILKSRVHAHFTRVQICGWAERRTDTERRSGLSCLRRLGPAGLIDVGSARMKYQFGNSGVMTHSPIECSDNGKVHL